MMQPRITIPLVAIVAALGMIAGSAVAAPAGNSNKLQCFSDPPATCAISASGIATLDNSAGGDSGVYITGSNLLGKRLSQVGRLSFNYTGTPTNGSPRVTLPLDTNADGLTDDYVSISAFFCNDGAGLVDIT